MKDCNDTRPGSWYVSSESCVTRTYAGILGRHRHTSRHTRLHIHTYAHTHTHTHTPTYMHIYIYRSVTLQRVMSHRERSLKYVWVVDLRSFPRQQPPSSLGGFRPPCPLPWLTSPPPSPLVTVGPVGHGGEEEGCAPPFIQTVAREGLCLSIDRDAVCLHRSLNPTSPYLTLPYLTLPCLALPYLILPYLT